MTEAKKIEENIFNLRQKVNMFLRANEPEQANKLLDEIRELEQKKESLFWWNRSYLAVKSREK